MIKSTIKLPLILLSLMTMTATFISLSSAETTRNYNIIEATNNEESNKFCIIEFVHSNQLDPIVRNHFYPLINFSSSEHFLCNKTLPSKNISGSFVLIEYEDECDVNQQIDLFSKSSIMGLLMSISCNVNINNINVTESTLSGNNFSISLIADSSVEKLIDLGNDLKVKLYDIDEDDSLRFDFSIPVIGIMATFAVVVGAYWSGSVRMALFLESQAAQRQCKHHSFHCILFPSKIYLSLKVDFYSFILL